MDSINDNDPNSLEISDNDNSVNDLPCDVCHKDSVSNCGYCHSVELCGEECFLIHLTQSEPCKSAKEQKTQQDNVDSDHD